MGKVFFHWIVLGIMIKMIGSIETSDSQSGSKSCNLTLRLNPNLVFFTGYQRLEIFKHGNSRSDYSLLDCRVHSVEIRRGFRGKIPFKMNFFTRTVTKKHNANLEVILKHRAFNPVREGFRVELDCNGRRCLLLSADSKRGILQSPWVVQRRKLLSLRTDDIVNHRDLPLGTPVLVAVAGIIVLVVALAMCACGNLTREKALSDEVGGTEVDHHVVAVSNVKIEEEQDFSEHVTVVKSEDDSSSNDRRNTNESKKSAETNSQTATAENGAVNVAGRTASQSIQLDKRSMGEVEPRPRSSGSRHSIDKVEEIALESSAPERGGTESITPEKTGSDKEVPRTKKESKDNGSSEARTRTESSEGAKKSIFRKTSRNRMESDGKEPKNSTEERENAEKKSFWQRRKSSKTKGNIENTENITPKKDKKKKKSEGQKTPEHGASSSRHTNLPLPPRPSSIAGEETQYDVVESRAQKPASNVEDADYEMVTTSKTRTYDKVNVLPKDQSRPASELYECINDQDAKMKRVSSGSNQYDVVETRSPPKKPDSLEYAYAVVASRDKPITPTETSGSSGLYEVVTDDIKQKSGVLQTQKPDIVVGDADYAVVQKDPSKKRASKEEIERYAQAEKQREKSLSGEIHPAPAPPPVSSLIHVSSSVRKRSEEDELNVDSPTDTASDRPQTMVNVDETYAKVNLAMKKRHSVEEVRPPDHQFAPASSLPEGFYEESDTPPPIPPSLYADLESIRKGDDEANENQPSSSTQPERESEENAYEEVTTKVEIKSITSKPIKTVSDLKITQTKDITIENQLIESIKSAEDPNGVLKRLKPPLGSPRNSDGRLSSSSLEGEKRFSSGSQHNYDEVVTKNVKTTQTERSLTASKSSKGSTSGHDESIENESKRNSDAERIVTFV